MRQVRLIPGRTGRDVNLPESVKHRSVLGNSLLFVEGRSTELTEEEWEHLNAVHPDLIADLEQLGNVPAPVADSDG